MKKNLEKVFNCASIVVAVILIMILLVTAFGGIQTDEFQTKLVQGLLITLAILYLVLAAISLVLSFISSEVIKEITIRSEQKGSIRVSVQVVTKMVKQACAEIEGTKCKKVTVISDEYGVRLKLNIKVVDKDVVEVETYVRTLLEDLFFNEFGFRFNSIEIKVVSLAPKYKADKEKIEASVAARLEQIRAEQAAADGIDGNADKISEENFAGTVSQDETVVGVAFSNEDSQDETAEGEIAATEDTDGAIDAEVSVQDDDGQDADDAIDEEEDAIGEEDGEEPEEE